MMIDLRRLIAALLMLSSLPAFADKIPLESFFKDLQYQEMVISPGGRFIAALYPSNGTTNALVMDLETLKLNALTGFKYPSRVTSVAWKSDDALVYEFEEYDNYNTRIGNIAVIGRDGRNHVYLLDNRAPDNVTVWRYIDEDIVAYLPSDPTSILIASDAAYNDFPTVYKANTRTGGQTSTQQIRGERFPTTRRPLFKPPGRKCTFVADHKAEVRVCLTLETDRSQRLLYREGDGSEWQELARFANPESAFEPVGFTDDDQALLVLSNVKRDNRALYVYELGTRTLGELVFEAPAGSDIDDVLFTTYGESLAAATYTTDGSQFAYFNADLGRAYGTLNKAFPERTVWVTSLSADGKKAVALVYDDASPGEFYLYDATQQRLVEIVARAPWLKGVQLASTRAIEFEARDKTRIEGFITLPPGREPKSLPLIVMPHGGPIGVRDDANFDPDAQFLASRGYAVLKINYRGSGGYGKAFQKAGYGEWGKKMQDDITDGVLWSIEQGIVDKSRICIYGASYGGYAAMMGLIRTPELYRCGITFAGVSDLSLLVGTKRILAHGLEVRIPAEQRRFWEEVVGERKDEATLRELSPRYNAQKIQVPVLIAHGDLDFSVPIDHADALNDALKAQGKSPEYFTVHNEGHGFHDEKNRYALNSRIEGFLTKYNPPNASADPGQR